MLPTDLDAFGRNSGGKFTLVLGGCIGLVWWRFKPQELVADSFHSRVGQHNLRACKGCGVHPGFLVVAKQMPRVLGNALQPVIKDHWRPVVTRLHPIGAYNMRRRAVNTTKCCSFPRGKTNYSVVVNCVSLTDSKPLLDKNGVSVMAGYF